MFALVAAVVGWVELKTSEELLTFGRRFIESGGYVAIVASPDGLPADRCERQASKPGVVAAGGFRLLDPSDTITSPGTPFRRAAITDGILDVWLSDERPTQAQVAGRWILGAAAADELGLKPGRLLVAGSAGGPVGAVIDTSMRNPEASRWLMTITPPLGLVSNCWIEFSPGALEGGIEGLWAEFAGASDLSVTRYRTLGDFSRNPIGELATRPQANAWIVIGGVLGAVAWLTSWFRRSELGLYRALGTSAPEIALMLAIETIVVVISASFLGLIWSVAGFEATRPQSVSLDQILIAARNVGSAALLGILLSPVPAFMLGRTPVAHLLKDRG